MKMKEIFKELIVEFQTGKLPEVIDRDIDLPVNSGKIISVIGVRRSGKTYVLFKTLQKLLTEKKVPIEKVVYINFEDERLEVSKEDLNGILEAYKELYPEIPLQDVYFFFDEIQNIDGWEKFIRRVYDSITKNIFITGSNSKLLSSEIATALRGRSLSFSVYPLNFREFLNFKGFKVNQRDIYSLEKRTKLKTFFKEYMEFGGFPEIVFLDEKQLKIKTLQEYFEVMLYKDLIERYQIKNPITLKYFIKRVIESVGKPLSINNIYNELKSQGYKTGKDILYSYLDMLESSFFVMLIKKFSKSVLKTELSQKKAYLVDSGFLNALTFSFKENQSAVLENLAVKELKSRGYEIFYFKEKKECDFVFSKEDKLIPVQVSVSLEDKKTKKREVEGIIEALSRLNLKEGLIITLDEKEEIENGDYKIKVVPAYEFFIQM